MRRLFFLGMFYVSVYAIGYSQNPPNSDELQRELKNARHDTTRVKVLTDLYNFYFYEQPELSFKHIQEVVELSESLSDKKWKIDSYNNLAYLNRVQGKYDLAIEQYFISLNLARDIGYNAAVSESLQGIGNTYWRKADYQTARRYHNENLSFCEEVGDRKGVASSYNNLGNIFNEEGDYTSALESYILASNIYKEIENERDYAISLGNIGLIQTTLGYFDKAISYYTECRAIAEKYNDVFIISWLDRNLGLNYKYLKQYDQSIEYYEKALASYQKQGDAHEIAQVFRLMGTVYLEKGDFKLALDNYSKSLKYCEQIQDSSGIANNITRMADVYYLQKRYDDAIKNSLRSKQIGELIDNPAIVRNAEADLAKNYAAIGDYKKAYDSFLKHVEIKDSLLNEEKNKSAQEMEARFQNEQKQREIENLQAQNEINELQLTKRENERNYLIGIVALILLLGILILRLYRIKLHSNKKLRELDELKTRFFANISHEFRTPLTLILGLVEEKLEKQPAQTEEQDLHIIQRNAHRLLNLINQLLDLSKMDAKSLRLHVEKTDINEHLRVIAASFSSLADQKGISFENNLSRKKIEAWFDPEKIEKIVYNLLSNAFKYTTSGGKISLTARFENDHLNMSIEDSGSGIPKDQVDKIFDRFFQVENAGVKTLKGTGIGLALVKELVELHYGNIDVKSRVGEGTKFRVRLPIARKYYKDDEVAKHGESGIFEKSHVETDLEIPEEVFSRDSSHSEIILVVEDDPDMLNYICRQLSDKYQIVKAHNGREGLEKAIDFVPELIVTDLMMPESDGIELCHEVRKNELTSHIPLVMLTAKADMESKLEGLETGADDYLTKPFDGRELATRVQNLITQRKNLHKKYSQSIYLEPKEITVTPKDETFVKKAIEVVDQYLDDSDFSMEIFQKEMGYSRMQLHRKLKALTDCSASEFIRNQRLKRAAQLLQDQNLNISEVCYMVGFNNLSYFTRSFRKQFGVSPKKFLASPHTINTTSED